MNLELRKGSRSRSLAVALFVFMIVFSARLFYLQIIKHDYYVDVAKREQVKRLTIPAKRGIIYGLDGQNPVPFVMNQTVYTIFADPQMINDEDKTIDTIRKVAGGNARPELQTLLSRKDSRYQILATRVSRVQADKIKSEKLQGIGFQEESQRVYPEGSLAAQALGFIDYSGVGRYGVEGKLNNRLTGVDGLLQSVIDVSDVPLNIGNDNIDQPAVNGDNIVLSIDRNIQSYAEQALADGLNRTGATKGSVIVMNPQTGKIMAMANLPTYDPSKFNEVEDVGVFNNGVVSSPYEPGSDVKIFTMATGIDKGVVAPDSTYVNTDRIQVEDVVISNASLGQTGEITFQHALNWSLNTGFVTIAQRLGDGKKITREARDTMYDYFYNKFRLGRLTDVEVAGESKGTVVPPTTTEGNAVRYSNMSFGQGMDVTMVQVAAAFGSVVNGGKYYKPTILSGIINNDGKYVVNKITEPSLTIAKSSANQVREMTHLARNLSHARGDRPGYYIGGKTGTSQVAKDGTYADDETIGTYLGFGGSEESTEYVIMVQVSGDYKKLEGGMHAMPIFTDISNWMLDYLDLQPKG